MTVDHYARAGRRWAEGATIVYGPLARQLVARSPHRLTGRVVLDAGAGAGAASAALQAVGAHPLALDLSRDMLAQDAARRPPAAMADIGALPLGGAAVDDSVASFVLNHLHDPSAALGELIRVTRPGGAVLACVFGNDNSSAARDRVDEVAHDAGWSVPGWYDDLKANAIPVLGSAPAMAGHAAAAGLVDVTGGRLPAVDVGVTTAEDLVDYRMGQAHLSEWLASIGEAAADDVRRRAIEAVRPVVEDYRPVVVFLAARTPAG